MRWYRQGLDLFEQLGGADDATRFELLVGLGDAQRQAGDPEFRTTLLDAAALARRMQDGPRLVRAVLANNRGFVSASGVVDDERLHALEDALDAVGPDDSAQRAVLLATLAAELAFSPTDRERRVELSDEALAIARRLDDPAALSRVLSLRFVTLWMPETLAERLANSEENVAAARRTGDPVAEFHAVHWQAAAFVEAGRLNDAHRDVEHEAALAERLGQPTMRWLATYDRANLEIIAGRLAEAEQHAHEALQIATLSAQPDALSFFTSQLTNIRYEQGRLAELQPLIAQVVADNPGIPAFRAVLALACCEGDLDDEARRILAHETSTAFAELPPDVTWLPGLAIYAEVAAHLQDGAAAEVLYDLLAPWAGQVVYSGISAWGSVDHHLGAVAGVIGRYAEAEEHLRQAAELNVALRAPIWVARTELATARLLLARDGLQDRERGRALLERAAAAAQRLGSATLARRAAGLLGYEKALSALPLPVMPNPSARAARTPPPRNGAGSSSAPAAKAPKTGSGGPTATLRLEGEIWTVTGAETVRLKDRKGLQYLATLLERPDVEVHAIDLVNGPVDAAARGRGDGGAGAANGELAVSDGGDAGALLDPEAKAAYRERVAELREDLEEAERFHDVERASRPARGAGLHRRRAGPRRRPRRPRPPREQRRRARPRQRHPRDPRRGQGDRRARRAARPPPRALGAHRRLLRLPAGARRAGRLARHRRALAGGRPRRAPAHLARLDEEVEVHAQRERHALVGNDPELGVQRVAVELVQRQVVVVAQLGHLDVLGDRGGDDDLLDVGAATVLGRADLLQEHLVDLVVVQRLAELDGEVQAEVDVRLLEQQLLELLAHGQDVADRQLDLRQLVADRRQRHQRPALGRLADVEVHAEHVERQRRGRIVIRRERRPAHRLGVAVVLAARQQRDRVVQHHGRAEHPEVLGDQLVVLLLDAGDRDPEADLRLADRAHRVPGLQRRADRADDAEGDDDGVAQRAVVDGAAGRVLEDLRAEGVELGVVGLQPEDVQRGVVALQRAGRGAQAAELDVRG